jgi:hypothetical protein
MWPLLVRTRAGRPALLRVGDPVAFHIAVLGRLVGGTSEASREGLAESFRLPSHSGSLVYLVAEE